jgi:nifR3 family TIM-barrel protein
MDGVGDHPFRHIQKKYGNPHLIYTEFTSVEALCHGDRQSWANLLYDESQRPIIAQIYGKTPHYYRQVAVLLCELGFDGIDLNMGCPAKTVANKGCGAGLIRTPDLAQTLIGAVKAGVRDWYNGATGADCPDLPAKFVAAAAEKYAHLPPAAQVRRLIPVSVKTRIGYDEPSVDAWLPRLLDAEPAAVCLHGRTLRQAYSGQADWTLIGRGAELARGTGVPILGNGDVTSLAAAHECSQIYGLDGVLIGRASFGNPFVFTATTPPADEQAQRHQLIRIAVEHARLYEETFQPQPRFWFLPMRKHLGWYIRDIRGARHLRTQLLQTNNAHDVEQLLRQHGVLTTEEVRDAIAISRYGPVHRTAEHLG